VTALAALVALPASYLTIRLLLNAQLGSRVVAAPSADRWHTRATPLFGGVGIAVGLLAGVGAALATGTAPASRELLAIVGGCAILFGAGLVDDLVTLNPVAKLAAQLGAAALVLLEGPRVEIVSNHLLATAIGFVWLVGVTNAFNLLDNMDGLAATLAAIACAYFAIDAVTEYPSHAVLAIALSLCLACAGFLPYNLRLGKPAVVFMGDSGSQVLGFALGSLGLSASWKVAGSTVATLILPLLILAVPILDTTLVTVVRLLEGRPIYRGGRDHTSHRLVYRGLSEMRAVVLLSLVSAGLGATSLAYNVLDDTYITLAGVLLTFAFLLQFGSYLGDVSRSTTPDEPRTGLSLVRSLVVHRRRLVEAVVDFALISASFAASYAIRLQGPASPWDRHFFQVALPALLIARYLAFMLFGLYRGVWRYAGARDAASVFLAVLASESAAFLFLWATIPWRGFPRGIFFIDLLLCSLLIGVARFWERAVGRGLSSLIGRKDQHRALIVGAGRSGRSLLRELRETPGERVVGFLDDDRMLRRRRIQGVAVAGALDEIGLVLGRLAPDTVFVTIPNAAPDRLAQVLEACTRAEVAYRVVRREIEASSTVALGAAGE
jgi:UDP-GlcNAc:undecaprenyl-phosphate/decaprenyl-phosphate GlcNAc-1-phosphate transferase